VRGPATPESHLGNAVHRALLAAGRRRRDGAEVTAQEILADLAAVWSVEPFPDPRREKVYRALADRIVGAYVASGGFERRMFHVEHPFEVDMGGWTLRGVIDRVDGPDAEGGPHVLVDYKTGAAVPASQLRRDLQLALYALGARAALGLDRLDLELVYLREGRSVRLPAEEGLLDAARDTAREVAASIAAGRFPAQPEPRRCRSCPYRLACDSAL
jgi:RecB family exonuclease